LPVPEKSVVVIANPASGRASRKDLEKAEALISAQGFRPEVLFTSAAGDGTRLAREAARTNPRLVIAAGGDGTINEVLNGLAGTAVPMAVLPLGTANVLARELGIPRDVEKAVDTALAGTPRKACLGRISFEGRERFFCLMAGIGYDAETVYNVETRAKKLTGKLAFILSGISTILSWDPAELVVTVDGSRHVCHSLIASNSRKYAGDFDFAPGADITAPLLHVFLVRGRKRLDILKFAAAVLAGRHLSMKGVAYLEATEVEVEGSAPIQTDGEFIGLSPARIRVEPGALSLVY